MCNNGLAYLDKAVVDEFDILAFWSRVPRKKKKTPVVNSRGNFRGQYLQGNKTLFVNMDREPVTIEGHRIAGYGKSKRNIKASFPVLLEKSKEFYGNKGWTFLPLGD